MKKALGFVVVFCVFSVSKMYAQKYGYINSTEMVQAMPEFKQMSEAVEKRKQEAQAKVQAMADSYQSKMQEMNQYGPSMMMAIKEEKTKEIDSLQMSINNYEQTASDEIQKFQNKLLKPLNDKYIKIVAAVAKENGYTYIFDLSTGGVVYHPDSGDITDLVKKKLGIN